MQQKKVGWEVIFSEVGFAGSLIVELNYHIKASLKFMIFVREIKSYLGKVCIFLPTLFYKNHRSILL